MRDMTPAERETWYARHACPHCLGTQHERGPRGGVMINLTCKGCGMRTNVVDPESPWAAAGSQIPFGQVIQEATPMKITLDYRNPTPSHCDVAVFVNGALAGVLTLQQDELAVFQHIVLHGIDDRRDEFLGTGRPGSTFHCPKCGALSFNPNDAAQQYCGRCHEFVETGAVKGLAKRPEQ